MPRDRRRPNFFCAVGVFTGARLRLQEDGDRFHILQNLREAVQAQLSHAVGSSVRALLSTSNGDEERDAAIACSPRDKHGDAEHRCLTRGVFTPAKTGGGFTDPQIPAGFAPFGIQNINGDLFVTYAKQNAQKNADVAGPGNGFVDVFDTDGHLLRRFASRGPLNSPWGVARASFAFGRFSGEILVGNFGNGKINVFDSRGRFIDELDGPNDKPLVIDRLWTLTLGGGLNSSSDTLYFTAGPNDEKDGLFGTITPVSKDKDD